MRNITVFTVLVIMINCAPFAAAQEKPVKPYALSTWTGFGMFLGEAEEIAYPSSEYKAKMLSQLLWDIKPVFYDSLALDFSRVQPMEKWGFFATLSLKIGFPGKSGEMEDRDWRSKENDALTDFSVHDNITNELFIVDASAGFSFPFSQDQFLLKTYVSMTYMRFSFSGQYGYGTYARSLGNGTYAPIDDDPRRESFADWEKVINYTQNWLTVAPGFSLASYFNRFYFEFSFAISPLVSCASVDEHLTNSQVFKDYMRGGVFIEPGFHFSFIASSRLEFSMDFLWRYIGGARGKTWYGSPIDTTTLIQQGEAGARLSLFNLGLCMKIRLAEEEKAAGPNRQSPAP
jgi:outer membrane protease